MNKNFIEQLNLLHNKSEHDKIVQIIEGLPATEKTYELKNLLARAYNNIGEYDKALEILLQESHKGANDPLFNFRIGYAFYYKDEEEKALPYFQKSSELGDTDADYFVQECIRNMKSKEVQQSTLTLDDIGWMFSTKHYSNPEEFNREITVYQKNNFGTDENWKPNDIVFDFPVLQIQYMTWITKPSDLLENETLIEEDKDIFEEYPDEDEHQVEVLAKLKADNGTNFTALEFLMKAHNQQANKRLGDHIFFEGTDKNPLVKEGLPTYYIACGS